MLLRKCGNGLDKVNGGVMQGKGPLILSFKSDEGANFAGFKVHYECKFLIPEVIITFFT